jgi:hemolysin activation/secretion protein
MAQQLPSSADVGRIRPLLVPQFSKTNPDKMKVPDIHIDNPLGKEASSMIFSLKNIKINGGTIFTPSELRNIYGSHIGKNISLNDVWEIAMNITKLYRSKGYFLSRAYIPAQEIDGGIVAIAIVEGYITKVDLDSDINNESLAKNH